jgi:3-hydroxybutyryl-CoA dehydratase
VRQRSFRQEEVDAFVALTGDSNPIHSHSTQRPIVPGLLAAALFPAIIGSEYPGVLYAKQNLKFISPIEVRSS